MVNDKGETMKSKEETLRNINKELESLRQKAEARGITEEDVENEIKAHRAGKIKQNRNDYQ